MAKTSTIGKTLAFPESAVNSLDMELTPKGQSEERLYRTIARRILQLINENAGQPDWRVPSERELADQLGVSRPVIREAIIALEMRGIVEVRDRAGIIVTNAAPQNGFDLARDAGPGPFELLEARLAVEAGSAAIAADRATQADIDILMECIERMQGENLQLLHESGDKDFHMHIARMTNNMLIVSITERLWELREQSEMWHKLHEHIHAATVRPLWIGDHYAVVSALKMRNADAAYRAMARHIRNVMKELLVADERGREIKND